MLPALAKLADLEARLGLDPNSLDGADALRAQAAIDDASSLVRDEARRDFLGEDDLPAAPDAIVRVVLGAALRNYRNPDGEVVTTVGPFSRTLNRTETGVYLTEAEQEIVRRYRQDSGGGLWTLQTTRDEDEDGTIWWEDTYGCELFPIGSTDEPWLT